MDRIRLTPDEAALLKYLITCDRQVCPDRVDGVNDLEEAVFLLNRRGLVIHSNSSGVLKLTPDGRQYVGEYPDLHNKVDSTEQWLVMEKQQEATHKVAKTANRIALFALFVSIGAFIIEVIKLILFLRFKIFL